MLKRRGYRFISLDEALKDKAYSLPDTYTGPVGISWIQRWGITKGMGFRKEPYLPEFMKQFDNTRASASDFHWTSSVRIAMTIAPWSRATRNVSRTRAP